MPASDWTQPSAGDGTKDLRWYDRCWLPLAEPMESTWRQWGWLQPAGCVSRTPTPPADSVWSVPPPTSPCAASCRWSSAKERTATNFLGSRPCVLWRQRTVPHRHRGSGGLSVLHTCQAGKALVME